MWTILFGGLRDKKKLSGVPPCIAPRPMLEAKPLVHIPHSRWCTSALARLEIGIFACFAALGCIPTTWTSINGQNFRARLTPVWRAILGCLPSFFKGCRNLRLRISRFVTLQIPTPPFFWFQRSFRYLWTCFLVLLINRLLLVPLVCLLRRVCFLCVRFGRTPFLTFSLFCQSCPQTSLLLRSHMVGVLPVLSSVAMYRCVGGREQHMHATLIKTPLKRPILYMLYILDLELFVFHMHESDQTLLKCLFWFSPTLSHGCMQHSFRPFDIPIQGVSFQGIYRTYKPKLNRHKNMQFDLWFWGNLFLKKCIYTHELSSTPVSANRLQVKFGGIVWALLINFFGGDSGCSKTG